MSEPRDRPLSAYLEAQDTLLVFKQATGENGQLFLALSNDGSVTAFNGHVDLGTGIRTALAQKIGRASCRERV